MDDQDSGCSDCPYCPESQQVICQQLYNVYSSSQNYYYTKQVNEIIEEALTPANVRFQDLQYLDDYEQFLKREYRADEYRTKMANINQYYYYHRDAPRMYHSRISKPYNRWQDRRKSFLYRKLKKMLNQPQSVSESENAEAEQQNTIAPPSRVLMDISDYNPYSKKYYLRKPEKREVLPTDTTKNMQEELKNILKSFSNLSELTIASEKEEEARPSPSKTTTKLEQPYKQLKEAYTVTKYNFKKKKITIEQAPLTEREGRSSILQRHSTQRKPSLLAFRRSQQQIVINQPQQTRRSLATISLSTKKEPPKENMLTRRSDSLKNVRVRAHKNVPEANASKTKLKKSEPAKRKERNDSTREFCDDRLTQPRVESYTSQQLFPNKLSKHTLIPTVSSAIPSLQTTQKWSHRPSINDQTMNRILRLRFDGK